MESRYFVQTISHATGEKSPMLFERATGLPDILANEWKLERRAVTRSHMTLRQELLAIALFYDFAAEHRVDLRATFMSGKGLSSVTIALLQEACWINRIRATTSGGAGIAVTDRVHAFRIDTIRKFCVWLLNRELELCDVREPASSRRTALVIYHAARHEKQMRTFVTESHRRRGLNDEQIACLFDVTAPQSESNPFQRRLRLRNYLIILILFHFGLRRGELLLLTTADVDYRARNPCIVVRRLPDSNIDRRDDVAVKTRERRMPLSDSVAYLIRIYIRTERARLPRATKTPFLFLGADGTPFGTDGFQNIFEVLRKRVPILAGLSGHLLRHTWADGMRARAEQCVKDGTITRELAGLTINFLGGWTPQSSMSVRYSQAWIESLANEFHLDIMAKNEQRLREVAAAASVFGSGTP